MIFKTFSIKIQKRLCKAEVWHGFAQTFKFLIENYFFSMAFMLLILLFQNRNCMIHITAKIAAKIDA